MFLYGSVHYTLTKNIIIISFVIDFLMQSKRFNVCSLDPTVTTNKFLVALTFRLFLLGTDIWRYHLGFDLRLKTLEDLRSNESRDNDLEDIYLVPSTRYIFRCVAAFQLEINTFRIHKKC